jgi:uncharacterized protein YndB with AHSA1/START domain
MEYGSIVRELRIGATPETVFDVVSNPEHVRQWWPDEANFESVPGEVGEVVFVSDEGEKFPVAIQVVDAIPYRFFSFRWTQPLGEPAQNDNSYLVTFELEPDGSGTLLRMTETGFRERGWSIAVIEENYRDHEEGWDRHLARLAPYITKYLSDRP